MKTKKLFLIIALVVGCAVGAHAQKTVFKFRDAQARAGDPCMGNVSVHHQIQLRCHHGSHFQSGR